MNWLAWYLVIPHWIPFVGRKDEHPMTLEPDEDQKRPRRTKDHILTLGDEPAVEPPADPRPWSAETNDLYVKAVQQAWDDLLRPDGPRRSLAAEALEWIVEGCVVSIAEKGSISLIEVWGWDQRALTMRARARYANRAALRLTKRGPKFASREASDSVAPDGMTLAAVKDPDGNP